MTNRTRIQAAVLSVALMLPAGSTFAATHHHRRHRHHYSQTRGAVVGAVAGALVDHHKPLKGALIGAAVGDAVQAVRNHKQ
jgi:YmgG-like glycine-zipper protein